MVKIIQTIMPIMDNKHKCEYKKAKLYLTYMYVVVPVCVTYTWETIKWQTQKLEGLGIYENA